MAKSNGLSVTLGTEDITKELNEALRQMAVGMQKTLISGNKSANAFTGLRAIFEAAAWKYGTIHRNKVTDERVMAVGYRKVTDIQHNATNRGWTHGGVSGVVDNWFDYWEVEQDT